LLCFSCRTFAAFCRLRGGVWALHNETLRSKIRCDCEAGLFEIRASPIHGLGGFATTEIARGTLVLEYVGEKIDKAESRRRCAESNRFIFYLDDDSDLDGNCPKIRLGFEPSCAPNCEAQRIAGQIWIVAIKPIHVGDEITFNYGYELADYLEHPCHCAAPNCVGYIVAEELFDDVRARTELRRVPTR
jgi:SET domain-containing protein